MLSGLRHAIIKLRHKLLHCRDADDVVDMHFLVIVKRLLAASELIDQHLRLFLGVVEARSVVCISRVGQSRTVFSSAAAINFKLDAELFWST